MKAVVLICLGCIALAATTDGHYLSYPVARMYPMPMHNRHYSHPGLSWPHRNNVHLQPYRHTSGELSPRFGRMYASPMVPYMTDPSMAGGFTQPRPEAPRTSDGIDYLDVGATTLSLLSGERNPLGQASDFLRLFSALRQ